MCRDINSLVLGEDQIEGQLQEAYAFASHMQACKKQMHRITPCSQKVMLRFRRWSRKEYAAFVSLHRHVTIGQVGRGIADASLGKQKTAVCEGKKTEGMSWTDLSGEDALFGSGGPGLGGSLFETDRTELWRLLVPQREEVPALLLDEINKITITGRDVSASGQV